MRPGLSAHFRGKLFMDADEVLAEADRISGKMSARGLRPLKGAGVGREELKAQLQQLMANPKLKPYQLVIHALASSGYAVKNISRHLDVHYTQVYQAKEAAENALGRQHRFGKISNSFGERYYLSFPAFLEHVGELSQTINEQPKPVAKGMRNSGGNKQQPLTEFDKRVAEIAQRHKTLAGSRYNHTAITLELLGKANVSEADEDELLRTRRKVDFVLGKLKLRGRIAGSTVWTVPKLNEVSDEEIEREKPLVHYVLNRGHPFLRRDWRKWLTYKEAFGHGKYGLSKAIERFDKTRGVKFSTYAIGVIAGAVSMGARQSAHRLEVPIEKVREKDLADARDEVASEAAESQELTKRQLVALFKLHKAHLVKSSEAATYALRLAGHTLQEIATQFGGVERERIRQIEEKTKQKLKTEMESKASKL